MKARNSRKLRRCWAMPTRESPNSIMRATPTTGCKNSMTSSHQTRRRKAQRAHGARKARESKEVVMQLDRRTLQEEIHALYRAEHETMGEHGTLERLEQARQWDLAPTLQSGGVLVFPHAGVLDCGHQIAAVVHACLDSGADPVIVISVLHAFTDEMEQARIRVAAGEDPAQWPFWGIQGPSFGHRAEWRGDHALMSFRHFWAAETKRRGISGPEVVERYPYRSEER